MTSPEPTRRRLLAGVVGSIFAAGLAGCSSDSDESTEETENAGEDGDQTSSPEDDSDESDRDGDESGGEDDGEDGGQDEGSSTDDSGGENEEDSSGNEDNSGGELNLREANVVGVEYDNEGTEYDFDVTLHHDDDGEDGYANWWQIERLDGTQLGRRDLLHAHSRQPFTRSEAVAVPEEVSCVVVRGHDQTHGYGGRAMVVNLETGTARPVDQGTEPQSFDGGACP